MEQIYHRQLETGDDVYVKALEMKGCIVDKHIGPYGGRLGVLLQFKNNEKWEEEIRWFFKNEVDTSRYPIYRHIENKYGFKDCLDINCTDAYVPLCSQCHCCIMSNRGSGTICDTCDHEFTLHCQHDYDEGMLY